MPLLSNITDRVREFFTHSDYISSQDTDFLERYYARKNPLLKKLNLGEIDDVYCSAKIKDSRFNTNVRPFITYLDEMSWGFIGTGPYTLATNILYLFTYGDEAFAREFALKFREDFLDVMQSNKSHIIPKELILDWIESKKGGANVQ